jgi:hypothetical protein
MQAAMAAAEGLLDPSAYTAAVLGAPPPDLASAPTAPAPLNLAALEGPR